MVFGYIKPEGLYWPPLNSLGGLSELFEAEGLSLSMFELEALGFSTSTWQSNTFFSESSRVALAQLLPYESCLQGTHRWGQILKP